jgi:phosphogluconate dehydratase
MLMEIMGLHLPGASFVNPNTPLRDALTCAATERALAMTSLGNDFTPLGQMLDERAFVNGIVGLHATGGSTNHTLHLVAMAAAAGLTLDWNDFADLAEVTPLLSRIYPNGGADVNHFHAAGGMGVLMRELVGAGLLHGNVSTVCGKGLDAYLQEPMLDAAGTLSWREAPIASGDTSVLRGVAEPFQATGGITVLDGDLGRAVIKTSAVAPERHVIEAPARVFHSQEELQKAFAAGELTGDMVAVVRFQGPKANAQADAAARSASGPGPEGRARHRRPAVRCLRQDSGRDPRHARSGGGRCDRQDPRRRSDPSRCGRRAAGRARRAR